MNMSIAKKLFHVLTIAATGLAAIPVGAVSGKIAVYVGLVSAGISGLLHLVTTLYPDAAKP